MMTLHKTATKTAVKTAAKTATKTAATTAARTTAARTAAKPTKKTVKPILSKTRLVSARALKRHLKYMMPEIKLALIREPGQATSLPIEGPDDLERYVTPMKFYSEEYFVAFHLNARHEVTSYNMVSKGSVSASLVHPREVFKAALLANTYAMIVAHNHPAGSLTPSREDLETTAQLIKAGKLLGVTVVDHVIVTASGIRSIRESHPDLWAGS